MYYRSFCLCDYCVGWGISICIRTTTYNLKIYEIVGLGKGRKYPTKNLFDEFNVFNLRQSVVKSISNYTYDHSDEVFFNLNIITA